MDQRWGVGMAVAAVFVAAAGTGWQAAGPEINLPLILTMVLVQLPIMVVGPLLLGWWIRRRYGVGWGVFLAGAGAMIASQVVHLPLNYALGLLGGGRGVALWPLVPLALVAGLSAGVCEHGAQWLILRFLARRVRSWTDGLQFGAGHGGIESVVLGLTVVLTLVNMLVARTLDLAALGLPEAQAAQARAQIAQFWATPAYMSLLAAAERVFAVTAQVAMALLVVRSVARRQPLYLLAAIAAHTALDAWAVWGARTVGALGTEAGLAVIAVGALWLIFRLREPMPVPPDEPLSGEVPTAAHLAPRALSPEELARRAEQSRYE